MIYFTITTNDILSIIILSLTCWRLSSLFAREKGPFDIFEKIQWFLGSYNNILFNTLHGGIICTWCNSVWFGFILSFLIANNIIENIIFTLAISTVSIFIDGVINSG